jgi:hypothetical protein
MTTTTTKENTNMTTTTTAPGLAEAARITAERIEQAILHCRGHSHRQPAHWVLTDEEGRELMGGYMTEVVQARRELPEYDCPVCHGNTGKLNACTSCNPF